MAGLMCKVDDKPLNKMWQNIVKVIDCLHMGNHKDVKYKMVFNPGGKISTKYNTMAAE